MVVVQPYARRRMKIYIAGPYSGKTPEQVEANVQRAIAAGLAVRDKGHHPYVPHLTHYLCIHPACKWEGYDRRWVEVDEPWVEVSDALLYLSPSRGADAELARAKALGKKIYYSIDEIPEAEEGPFTGAGY